MLARIPILFWPAAWVALWMLGASTATAMQISAIHRRRPVMRIRTPLLRLHVSTMRLRPHAGERRPDLHLVDLHDADGDRAE